MEEQNFYNFQNELGEGITINIKKILLAFWSRKMFIVEIFTFTLIFFILSTFISTKKWKETADLYINKTNSTNYMEINPYAIEEANGLSSLVSNKNPLSNELELIQSPLVIDKVIQENNLRFKKLFGIIPTKKTGEYLTTEKFLKQKISFENRKGTNVISISYTSKDKQEAYNVVASIITNYVELHKELNSEKSKSDKQIIESEYNNAKKSLSKKINSANGLPSTSLSGTGNLAAMSAFSSSARNAMSTLQNQYISSEKSRIDITEDATKVAELSSKLEWAKLVEEMSGSSKVLIIKDPRPLRDWEYASPKLFTNIIIGIVLGILFSLFGVLFREFTDKKLSYLMLGNNIIYNLDSEFDDLSIEVVSQSEKKNLFIFFEQLSKDKYEKLKEFANFIPVYPNISSAFKDEIKQADNVVIFASLNKTSSKQYKLIKKLIKNLDKNIIYEVLV